MQESLDLPLKAVSFRGVEKSYGPQTALSGLDLSIPVGNRVCLLGPNGAGKSTAIRLMLGLENSDRGDVEILGRPPRDRAIRMKLACTPQDTDFPEYFSVEEVLRFVRAHYPNANCPLTVAEELNLKPILNRRVSVLSGGQRRLLALACALISGGEVLFFDEPTVALDVEARNGFWRAVRTFCRDQRTVVFTTHYLAEAEEHADHVIVIHRGRLLRSGAPHEIRGGLGLKRIRFRWRIEEPPMFADCKWDEHTRRWVMECEEADQVLPQLLMAGAFDLEVQPLSLEEAFLRLVEVR